jgi:DNA-directed RNA polymerase specialized sigma24 family protein
LKPSPTYSDSEIISLVKEKDPRACDWLFEKYAPSLHGMISQVVAVPALREKILQDSFITICNKIHQFDPGKCRLFTWMTQVTREATIQQLHSLGAMDGDNIPVIDKSRLEGLMGKLQPEEQKLIHLSWLLGYSADDVARHLNIPADIAKSKIRNALIQLRTFL